MSESRNEVAAVKNYIYQHYEEDLSLEMLAEKVYLSSGYLKFYFQKGNRNEPEPFYPGIPARSSPSPHPCRRPAAAAIHNKYPSGQISFFPSCNQ